ncbi:acyl-CoA dehydrogenase family protein [Streptomyces sp. NPDC048172]|uniref:acyl-CoA dehydrogenase family protein n=1 Tax=Streptomyces sp. NPDC048172 TaxID=3365505 RepID=UPI00371A40B9
MADTGITTRTAAPPRSESPFAADRRAEGLDRFLGDPRTPGSPFSYADIVAAEERDELPAGAVELLRHWGFQRHLVPEAYGGALRGLEELCGLTRVLSRRNATLAVMYGSALLGANPVWLWGSGKQRDTLAAELLKGGLACCAVSEVDHGSDLRATGTTAVPDGDGGDGGDQGDGDRLLLTGSKWPVGNATRARFVTLLAQEEQRGGHARKPVLLLLDKQRLDTFRWSPHPQAPAVGLRGHDLSGLAFDACPVPPGARLGHPGTGLARLLKALQITRTGIGAMSLGTVDAAVRIALDHARTRRLYGRTAYDIPVLREQLLDAHLDVLVGECALMPVARALTLAPERLALWSLVVKYFVPVLAEGVMASMGSVLGARGYLREGTADGVFQKLQRDHAIASVFEGTTHVNLHGIACQLPQIARPPATGGAEGARSDQELLGELFALHREAPPWTPDARRLRLAAEGRDEIAASWPALAARAAGLPEGAVPPAVRDALPVLLATAAEQQNACFAVVRGLDPADPEATASVRAMDAAARHCVLHAMASCVLVWLHNRDAVGGRFADGGWLVLCLRRLLDRLGAGTATGASTGESFAELRAEFEEAVLRAADRDEPFTLAALRHA